MFFKIFTLVLLPIVAYSIELNAENWQEQTNGKVVFVKFFAPWCGHCKKLAPTWKRVTESNENEHVIIAKVDCTQEQNKELCSTNSIRGYPTLKYGDPDNLEDYKGARDYTGLKEHVDGLTPPCTPINMDFCSENDVKMLNSFVVLETNELNNVIKGNETILQDLQDLFEEGVKHLQQKYESIKQDLEERQSKIRPVLRLMRAATIHRKQKDEL